MRQRWRLAVLCALTMALAVACGGWATTARADEARQDWSVVFTADDQMRSTFSTDQMDEAVSGLQPGDSVAFSVSLQNQNSEQTDWYMENRVIASLERSQSVAQNGAYSYRLTYTDAGGTERVLYDSEGIGGTKEQRVGAGLEEATDSLDEMFYLDTLATGRGGRVDLTVALEGETQGNAYQDTRANLRMDFAVEKRAVGSSEEPAGWIDRAGSGFLPETGDPTSYVPLVALTGVGGLALLAGALVAWRRRDREADEGGRR